MVPTLEKSCDLYILLKLKPPVNKTVSEASCYMFQQSLGVTC